MAIDRYEVTGELGVGGFAQVYQVWDPDTQDTYALKWLLPEKDIHTNDQPFYEDIATRFIEEYRTLNRLQDIPGVINARHFGHWDDRPYFTLELMQESLADVLVEGDEVKTIESQMMIEYAKQLLAILDQVHQAEVVHRDLNPGNVLLDGARMKLADFGLAWRPGLSRLKINSSYGVAGTEQYAAPEQWAKSGDVGDCRVDLWSVGAMIYRGLSGRYPRLEMESSLAALQPVVEVTKAVSDVVACFLEKEPEKRPATAGEALAMLTAAVNKGEMIGAMGPEEVVPMGDERRHGISTTMAADADQVEDEKYTVPADESWPRLKAGDILTEEIYPGVEMAFVYVPPGTFLMGSLEEEGGEFREEGPQHEVEISRGFYLGQYVVTQNDWASVMKTKPWKKRLWEGKPTVKSSPDHPTVCSWEDAETFIKALNVYAGQERYGFPTEAQWEYACRAGTAGRWSFGDDVTDLSQYAWYVENTCDKGEEYAHGVGLKEANAWGLYDMHGNVFEWCADWYGVRYGRGRKKDPVQSSASLYRVARGGSFGSQALSVRSASRSYASPDGGEDLVGFRLARVYNR